MRYAMPGPDMPLAMESMLGRLHTVSPVEVGAVVELRCC